LVGVTKTPVAVTPNEIVWSAGKTSLYRIEGPAGKGPPVLVIHSLVSKPWILDLTPERSLLKALSEAGFTVFLLDWGDFDGRDAHHDLSHFATVLLHAEEKVLQSTGAEKLHLVGYCLGATLLLARLAARSHPRVASAALIAAPSDFGVPSGLQMLMSHRLFKPSFFLDGSSCVPESLVRESFHMLRPRALSTVRALVARRSDERFRRVYGATSRWVWEHRRLPGALFFDLVDLFRTNALFAGRMEVAGELARLEDIKVPIGAFVAARDHIVPSGSSHALTSVPGLDVEVFDYPSGHVSMVCGSAAREAMWADLHSWLARQGGAKVG
jgi:polyhydroxyalkanoate synthase